MKNCTIAVDRIAGALGAEISGVDLSQPLSDGLIAEVRQALLDHQVIFFRDQRLTPDQHLAFGRRFGELQIHDFVEAAEADQHILEVRKEPYETRNFGGGWHTPMSVISKNPRSARFCTRTRCLKPAATRCSRTSTWPTTRCRTA